MKKVILAVTMILLGSTYVFAHCGTCPLSAEKGSKGSHSEDWMQKKMEKMTTGLGLSAEQASQVEALMKTKMEKKKAVKEEKKRKMEAIKEEFHANMKTVLNPEQLEKFEQMRQEKGSMKGSGHDCCAKSGQKCCKRKGSGHEGHNHKGSH